MIVLLFLSCVPFVPFSCSSPLFPSTRFQTVGSAWASLIFHLPPPPPLPVAHHLSGRLSPDLARSSPCADFPAKALFSPFWVVVLSCGTINERRILSLVHGDRAAYLQARYDYDDSNDYYATIQEYTSAAAIDRRNRTALPLHLRPVLVVRDSTRRRTETTTSLHTPGAALTLYDREIIRAHPNKDLK